MGIYSIFVIGAGAGGPAYIWTIPVVVLFMTLVALVFGQLASEYPLSGALYQYGKFNVGARYGWFVGWIYGFALLATVASVDSGIVSYVTDLMNIWFKTHLDPANHVTIFVIVAIVIVLSAIMNSVGAKILGRVARYGVYVETVGTFGVFIALAIKGFHHGLGYLSTTQGVQTISHNPFGVNFGGHWLTGRGPGRDPGERLHLLRVRVSRRHRRGDQGRRTSGSARHAQRDPLRRSRLLRPGARSVARHPQGRIQGSSSPAAYRSSSPPCPGGSRTSSCCMVIIAFFSCGTAVMGAGSRVTFALARDGAIPGRGCCAR